jgi:hypothetical protein
VAFLVLNLLPFLWIFFSLGLGRKFYGDMTGSVGKDARQEGSGIDRSLSFEDVAGACVLVRASFCWGWGRGRMGPAFPARLDLTQRGGTHFTLQPH